MLLWPWRASGSTVDRTRNKARRVPYRGVAANHLWLTTRAAAVNLVRLTNLGVTHNNGASEAANRARITL